MQIKFIVSFFLFLCLNLNFAYCQTVSKGVGSVQMKGSDPTNIEIGEAKKISELVK